MNDSRLVALRITLVEAARPSAGIVAAVRPGEIAWTS
jgi:hypothetical protein